MTDPFQRRLTRRQLIRRAAAGGAAFSLPGLLAACGGDGIEGAGQDTGTAEQTTTVEQVLADTLRFANWPLYIDVSDDEKTRPTLRQFTRETGVEVEYIEEINDNEEYFGRIQAPLSQGQSIDRDLMVLTDFMAARLVDLGWLAQVDKSAIPNASNLLENYQGVSWDPERQYSLPWQGGMTGIGYNRRRVGFEINSIDQRLDEPSLRGRVTLLSEMGDTVPLVMLSQGNDPNEATAETFDEAMQEIDPELAENTLIFPDEEMLANVVETPPEFSNNEEYKEQFQALLGG